MDPACCRGAWRRPFYLIHPAREERIMAQNREVSSTTKRRGTVRGKTGHALLLVLLVSTLGSGVGCGKQDGANATSSSADAATAETNRASEELETEAGGGDIGAPGAVPDVDPAQAFEAAPGVTVIPDPRIDFVPNIGIVEGSEAVLVVDTGLGASNGKRVLWKAREIAGDRRLYLTTTHFHPEHSFGASAFQESATLILNEAQANELQEKGPSYIDLFKTFGAQVAERLESTLLVEPDRVYSGEMTLDLGDREVILREIPAHTRGDQLIYLPDANLIFTGDIAETRFFPIMPDADSSADRWIAVLRDLEALEPEIVVPGHGAVGGAEVLVAPRLHIEFMRDRVRELAAADESQQAITDLLVPAVTSIYPAWDNQVFLAFEIAILYAEATDTEPELPGF
jgi:glyoxylase-like metal-dependent hydrolase (beta-lactamase superfamily II)